MPSFTRYALAALVAAVPFSSAQTSTKCNPLKESCSPNGGLNQYNFYSDFTQGDSALDGWTTTSGNVTTNSKGAVFTINKQGDAPTIQSEFAIFFGELEVKMQAAPGTGIVSSLVFESDDLDEIDWEALGGDTTQVQTDYFGKGNTSTYDRATFINVNSPQTSVHTYSVVWTSASIVWYVDGNSVRTLQYADAVGGSNFPQTPMRIKIGIWAGGDPSNGEGTIEWAGGETDFSKAPFTMYVESVKVINYNPASTYTYTDQTGSYQSIKASNSSTTSGSFSASSSDEPSSSSTSSSSSSSTSSTLQSSSTSTSSTVLSSSNSISSTSSTPSTFSSSTIVSSPSTFSTSASPLQSTFSSSTSPSPSSTPKISSSSSTTDASNSPSPTDTSSPSSDSPSALAASGSLASLGASSTGQTSSGASAVSLGGSFMLLTLIAGLFSI